MFAEVRKCCKTIRFTAEEKIVYIRGVVVLSLPVAVRLALVAVIVFSEEIVKLRK
jgi:hypothetical protein